MLNSVRFVRFLLIALVALLSLSACSLPSRTSVTISPKVADAAEAILDIKNPEVVATQEIAIVIQPTAAEIQQDQEDQANQLSPSDEVENNPNASDRTVAAFIETCKNYQQTGKYSQNLHVNAILATKAYIVLEEIPVYESFLNNVPLDATTDQIPDNVTMVDEATHIQIVAGCNPASGR